MEGEVVVWVGNGARKPLPSCAGTEGGRCFRLARLVNGDKYRSQGAGRRPHLVQDVDSCVRRMVTQSRDHPVIKLLFPYLHQLCGS